MRKIVLLLCVGLLCMAKGLKAQQTPSPQKVRTLVNLLDYIGKDYPNAVKDGKILSQTEYQEMVEFSTRIKELQQQLDDQVQNKAFSSLVDPIKKLGQQVHEKASPQTIAELSGSIQQQVLALNLIDITPSSWPDIRRGQQLFTQNCQTCHGAEGFGDGPQAKNLTPAPSNFHDDNAAAELSPLQAYNTIRLGINGTAMRPFQELSDQQVWDIAFYVNRLNYQDQVSESSTQRIKTALKDTASLRTLTTWKNKQWASFFDKQDIDPKAGMSVLRSMDIPHKQQDDNYLARAITMLKSAREAYASNNADEAHRLALNAYLHGIEPVENEIKASKPSLVSELETKMIDTRSAIKENKPAENVQRKIEEATLAIKEAQNLISNQDYSFWFTFTMALSILLREGLEAVLIIMVIISVLKSMGAQKSLKYVHGGWLIALGLGIVSWFFAKTLIQMSSYQREIMEGAGSLIAVGILIYIGFWLHNKTHASQWTKFVKEKITRLVDDNNRWGLAFLAFVVVFREAFESVIFLSSISIKSTTSGNSGIMLGSLSAMGIVLVFATIAIRFSKRLPVRTLFKYSSFIMSLLAVVLVGKGIHEFQEAGYLAIHSLPALPGLPILGLYPTLFTVLAQLVIALFIVALWQYSKRLAVATNS